MNVISEGPRVHGTADNRRGITNIPRTERKSRTNKQPQEAKGRKGRTKMATSASLSLYTQQTTGYLQRITLVCIQELSSAMLFQSLADRIEASIHEFFLGQISSSRLLFQPSRFFLAYRVLFLVSVSSTTSSSSSRTAASSHGRGAATSHGDATDALAS